MARIPNKFKHKLKVLNGRLTKIIKDYIKENHFVSGDMMRKTFTKLSIKPNGEIDIKVISEVPYYDYVDDGTKNIAPQDITKRAFTGSEYNKTIKEIKAIMVDWQTEAIIKKIDIDIFK